MKTASIWLAIFFAASVTACDDKESSENETPLAQDTDIERQGADTASTSVDSAMETDEENETGGERNTDPGHVDSAEQETDTTSETEPSDSNTEDTEETEETEETDTESATDKPQETDPEIDTGEVEANPPCYGVGEQGCCRGNTVHWCWNDGTNDHLGERDCGTDECGWSDKLGWFKCKPPGGSDPVPDGIEAECPSSLP